MAEALESPATEPWLSPISTWELALLADRGRIELEGGLRAWVDEAMRAAPMQEAPLTHGVVRQLDSIETPHRARPTGFSPRPPPPSTSGW